MTLFWTKVFFPFVQLRLVQYKTWVIENAKSYTHDDILASAYHKDLPVTLIYLHQLNIYLTTEI